MVGTFEMLRAVATASVAAKHSAVFTMIVDGDNVELAIGSCVKVSVLAMYRSERGWELG